MIGKDGFWEIIETYGLLIRPAQVAFYLTAVVIIGWLVLRPGRAQTWVAKLYLATAFAWNGVAFYFVLARDLAGGSHGNDVFGAVFLVVAGLFALDLFRNKMRFFLPPAGMRRRATVALALLVLAYPLFGLAFGHGIRGLITPGVFPCPTTALALLLLTTALPRVDKLIYVLLVICAVPFTPFVQIARYGVYEDAILVVVGLYSFGALLRYRRGAALPV